MKMVKIVAPRVEVLTPLDGETILKHIELCARNCYKSEGNISEDCSSAVKMINKLIELDHTAMIEHYNITVKFVCDLGFYKDITRHRHASFAIESTRYCNYSKGKFGSEISVIKPCNIVEGTPEFKLWLNTMETIEKNYNAMAALGCKPDQLRMLLPHSIKADVIMTANLREWRHILKLRAAPAAHPSIQQLMKILLKEFKAKIPVVFDDIPYDEENSLSEKIAAE